MKEMNMCMRDNGVKACLFHWCYSKRWHVCRTYAYSLINLNLINLNLIWIKRKRNIFIVYRRAPMKFVVVFFKFCCSLMFLYVVNHMNLGNATYSVSVILCIAQIYRWLLNVLVWQVFCSRKKLNKTLEQFPYPESTDDLQFRRQKKTKWFAILSNWSNIPGN